MNPRDEIFESLGVSQQPAQSPWVKDGGWGFDFTRGGKWHFYRGGKSVCKKFSLPEGTDLAPLKGREPEKITGCCVACCAALRKAQMNPELFTTDFTDVTERAA